MDDTFSVGPNNSFPSVYIAYSSPGFHFPLFFPAFLGFVSIVGIFLNLSVCYITWKYWGKYTTFKSKTSVLIAINSFLEVLHQSGHFVFLYVTATGINFIQSSLAFKLETHSITIAHCVSFMFMTLSIDRVLAVAFPVFYVQLNFRLYICLHIIAIVIFFIFNISTLIISINEYPNWPVTGYIGDLAIGFQHWLI
uniref:G_PROTEIN_RECEP_F1_2 domain-containing protein n=1 Tax=Meloidogyne incognita TaxID=6306 RepID=A0A914KZK6_MELIC